MPWHPVPALPQLLLLSLLVPSCSASALHSPGFVLLLGMVFIYLPGCGGQLSSWYHGWANLSGISCLSAQHLDSLK